MEPNDSNLMKRWKHGDDSAAALVVERYANALGAVAFTVLHDASLAEDAVQETFARASASLGKLNGVQQLGPWLVGIARHVALDVMRRQRRETPLDGHEVAARSSPQLDASRSELRACLSQALEALPEDQRELFTMKYVGGLSYAEMAVALGMTPEAVGQKLWRVRQKLQEALKEHHP